MRLGFDDRLRRCDYWVADVPLSVGRDLIGRYHYARGTSNTAVYVHGLIRRSDGMVVGVAWWLPPTRVAAEASWDGDWRRVLSLSRLVIAPDVPKNAATFLLAGSVRIIRRAAKWECLVTYADEWRGHSGGIYRASNWEYCGLTQAEPVWVDGCGRMVARKAGPKTRTALQMSELGYSCVGRFAKHKFRMALGRYSRRLESDSGTLDF